MHVRKEHIARIVEQKTRDQNLIESRKNFYRKLNSEIESTWKKLRNLIDQDYPEKNKRRIPIPIEFNLYAEYLVMQQLLELSLDAVHNKEDKDKWPMGVRRDLVDVCILSERRNLLVEVKYSKDWGTQYRYGRWQFENINPQKFDFLILVAEAPDKHRFFVFTKQEAETYIPPVDWAWKPDSKSRWVGIFERPDDWRKHMKEWMPRQQNPQNAKNKYMLYENSYVGYIATHLNNFENKWKKISESVS